MEKSNEKKDYRSDEGERLLIHIPRITYISGDSEITWTASSSL
jgi:hypothetical protein